MRSIRSELLALAALSCACDPQVDGGYLGEPLAIFDGYVSSASVAPLEAAMLWQRGPPPSTDDQELATRARVVAGFPARFTLRLYRPPPAAAQRTLAPGEVPYARANAAAVPYGIADGGIASGPSGGPAAAPPADAGTPDAGTPDAGPPSTGPASALYGMDPRHWIVYLPQDVPPGSLMEWWLGGAPKAGFRLLSIASVNPACMTGESLDACAADLARRGVPDDGTANAGTARSFCLAPYRLQLAPHGDQLVLDLGTAASPPPSGSGCP